MLGSIGVRFSEAGDVGEIGYWLRADARGRGLITRALGPRRGVGVPAEDVERLQLRADIENVAVTAGGREGGLHARGRAPERALERAATAQAGLGDVLTASE